MDQELMASQLANELFASDDDLDAITEDGSSIPSVLSVPTEPALHARSASDANIEEGYGPQPSPSGIFRTTTTPTYSKPISMTTNMNNVSRFSSHSHHPTETPNSFQSASHLRRL